MPPSVGGGERFPLCLNGESPYDQEVENFSNTATTLGGVVSGAQVLGEFLEGAVRLLRKHSENLVGHVKNYREIP